jgi:DNA-directed RNA polymerase subunit E'/Rpb7
MNDLTITTTERKICIDASALSPQLQNYIVEKLNKELVGTCDEELGYIISVNNIQLQNNNTVSTAAPTVFFTIKFDIHSLKPVIGHVYRGVVGPVMSLGIFVEVETKMRILVIAQTLKPYLFDQDKYKHGRKTIKTGDSVKVELTMFQFENQAFSFIGKLVN